MRGEQWVVCPSCQAQNTKVRPWNTKVKPRNIAEHLAKVHMLSVSYRDRLYPWCKVAVPPEQLVNHTACKHSNQPCATGETPLKPASPDVTSSSLRSSKVPKLCGSATMQPCNHEESRVNG